MIRWHLTPADFWRLSPRQFDHYQRAHDERLKFDAEVANQRAAKHATYLIAAITGKSIEPTDLWASLYGADAAREASQAAADERLDRRNAIAFDQLVAVAEMQYGRAR